VNVSVASGAKGDQVLLGIVAGLAAKLFVMHFKIGHRAARLASPAVAAENSVEKLVVQFAVQAEAWSLWSEAIHEALSVA
jgi:hypothetical protein